MRYDLETNSIVLECIEDKLIITKLLGISTDQFDANVSGKSVKDNKTVSDKIVNTFEALHASIGVGEYPNLSVCYRLVKGEQK